MKTYTSNQVAEKTGKTRRTVLQAAKTHEDIGHKHGRDWVFTDSDIAKIKAMSPGAPGKPRARRAKAPAPVAAQPGPAGATQGQEEAAQIEEYEKSFADMMKAGFLP